MNESKLPKATSQTTKRESVIIAGDNNVVSFSIGKNREVLETIDGQHLSEYLEQKKSLSETELLQLMRNIFSALQHLHTNGWVHRDLKPENIIVTAEKKVLLIDFGLAKGTIDFVTQERNLSYSPPERFEGIDNFRSDIYSLGAILYKILTGNTPPISKPTTLTNLRPDVSPRMTQAIEKALELKPENRWGSVSEFWSAMTDMPLENQANDFTEFIFIPIDHEFSNDYPKLTPSYLATTVSPYLNAIVEIQKIIDDAKELKHHEISISLISQKSPISVSLDGASEAIGLIKDTVVPWRRKHAETMSQLLEQEKQAEIELKKAEILEKRAQAAKERVEATKQHEETEKLKLENEKLRLELQRAKVQLAIDVLTQIAPNLSEADKISYVVRLLPPLDVVIFSELEISNK